MKKVTPGAPRASALASSDTVVVVVGSKRKRYTLHKRLLTQHSGCFRRVIVERVKENHVYPFRGSMVQTFNVFVDWMYEKILPSYTNTLNTFDILGVYMLAEKLFVGGLRNAVIDRLFLLLRRNSFLTSANVIWLFKSSPGNNPLLQLAVDAFCINKGMEYMSANSIAGIDGLPQEYLARILRKMHHLSKLPEAERKLKREDCNTVDSVSSKDKDKERLVLRLAGCLERRSNDGWSEQQGSG